MVGVSPGIVGDGCVLPGKVRKYIIKLVVVVRVGCIDMRNEFVGRVLAQL